MALSPDHPISRAGLFTWDGTENRTPSLSNQFIRTLFPPSFARVNGPLKIMPTQGDMPASVSINARKMPSTLHVFRFAHTVQKRQVTFEVASQGCLKPLGGSPGGYTKTVYQCLNTFSAAELFLQEQHSVEILLAAIFSQRTLCCPDLLI